jgi:hypothetical protein
VRIQPKEGSESTSTLTLEAEVGFGNRLGSVTHHLIPTKEGVILILSAIEVEVRQLDFPPKTDKHTARFAIDIPSSIAKTIGQVNLRILK